MNGPDDGMGATERPCFHCGLPIPRDSEYRIRIGGEDRSLCCPGCAAVAGAIAGAGLTDYYRFRESPGNRPEDLVPEELRELKVFDDPEVQRDFVRREEGSLRQATLAFDGITCAACGWLIETHLAKQDGVERVHLNQSQRRAWVCWDDDRIRLSRLLGAVSEVGYRARPWQPDRQEQMLQDESRRALRRLGVAGLGAMQVMMFSAGLYAGAFHGIEIEYRDFLRWVSFLLTTPIVFYSAQPFFVSAWRDLRIRRLGMDVPVSLALGSAWAASTWATFRGSGEVYFDSVCMFTFFLLLGRYLEQRARHRADSATRTLLRGLPRTAVRLGRDGEEVVPVRALAAGDRVLVKPGAIVPADGRVLEGESSVDESLVTGESLPRSKAEGDALIGGTQNIDGPLLLTVTQTGPDSVVATIVAMRDRASAEKPPVAELADRVARHFVGVVLAIAAAVGLVWWKISPADAFWVTLSVLVATCPCALAIATPAALFCANNALARSGVLITRGHVLETLSRITHVLFDKTGTLTAGCLSVRSERTLREVPGHEALGIAAALECQSEHPIAAAFTRLAAERAIRLPPLRSVRAVANQGLQGTLGGSVFRIGRPAWVAAQAAFGDCPELPSDKGMWVLLGDESGPLAWFELDDPPRPEASGVVAALRARGLSLGLLSGDPSAVVPELAAQLGIEQAVGGAVPEEKLRRVHELQRSGAVVAMLGDGVNDAPVLGAAHVALAMAGGTDLAKNSADAVLLGDDLRGLIRAIDQGGRTRRIIRQNLAWALAYNLSVLPLAAAGQIVPWVAAAGMSLSSLLVTVNALRLNRIRGAAGSPS
jgi:Cu2+-exporting ATPase